MQSKHIEVSKKNTITSIAYKRFTNSVKRKRRKKLRLKKEAENILRNKLKFVNKVLSLDNIPPNLKYLMSCKNSCFHIDKLYNLNFGNRNGVLLIPRVFSLLEKPKETFKFIQELTASLLLQKYSVIRIDYSHCSRIELGAQVFLDVILRDLIVYFKNIRIINIERTSDEVKKLLFSVGSPAIHANKSISFNDIIPYKLCIRDRESNAEPLKIMEKKDIDTTELVDYVLESLKRLNIELSPEEIDSLCTVVGEILINAEEHSTNKFRFSIGYFQEKNYEGKHFGIFKLVIFNLGKTIYEKFKYDNNANAEIAINTLH
jgi:hypothetical protein